VQLGLVVIQMHAILVAADKDFLAHLSRVVGGQRYAVKAWVARADGTVRGV
jgi:hypothetical protein